jgi:hypothetical protein
MSRPQVLNFSVGESIHLIFIRFTRRSCLHLQIQIEIRVGLMIVPVSLPQLAVIRLLKIKMKSSNSIQEINNLRKKMVERTYYKV